ncbi:WSC domain-containing protein [Ceratocystis lukuohia]|uniref:WSC domain-containing protein n=1 Tax=Ceratocystis lukuohia TaxID=2019550 RepID=A0ABR4MPI9_9PEZI
MRSIHVSVALSTFSFAAARSYHQLTNATSPFTYKGCYVQTNSSAPALDGPTETSNTAEVADCSDFCSGYQSFSIDADWTCSCRNKFDGTGPLQGSPTCSDDCSETDCRKDGGISLYENNEYRSPVRYDDSSFPYIGCYKKTNSTDFIEESFSSPAMTATKCVDYCLGSGMYYYFAVENGTTCYCSSYLDPGAQVEEAQCNSQCGGDSGETCGGRSRMTMYGKPQSLAVVGEEPYYYQGCYPDNTTHHRLTAKHKQSEAMDLEACREACSEYPNFGVENGNECFCGRGESWRGDSVSNDYCSTPCAGHAGLACGGDRHLSIYSNSALRVLNPSDVNGYNRLSCWTNDDDDPSLSVRAATDPLMSLGLCQSSCADYEYFATLNGTQCLCGNSLSGGAALENQCNIHCGGDAGQWCGGVDHLYVYKKANLPA